MRIRTVAGPSVAFAGANHRFAVFPPCVRVRYTFTCTAKRQHVSIGAHCLPLVATLLTRVHFPYERALCGLCSHHSLALVVAALEAIEPAHGTSSLAADECLASLVDEFAEQSSLPPSSRAMCALDEEQSSLPSTPLHGAQHVGCVSSRLSSPGEVSSQLCTWKQLFVRQRRLLFGNGGLYLATATLFAPNGRSRLSHTLVHSLSTSFASDVILASCGYYRTLCHILYC